MLHSGHGTSDLGAGQPFLLPSDGSPDSAESGFARDALHRNLALVKELVGDGREVIVMIDACLTSENR